MVDRFLCADIPHIFWDFSKNAGEMFVLWVFCCSAVGFLRISGVCFELNQGYRGVCSEHELRISGSLWPSAVSCETVDRYIIAWRRCFRSMPHAGLRVYASSFCGADYDGLLFLFCMRLYWFAALVCFADGFACFVFGLTLFLLFMWANFSLLLAEFRPCEGDLRTLPLRIPQP